MPTRYLGGVQGRQLTLAVRPGIACAISFHMPLDSPYCAIRLLSVWSSQLVQLRRALRGTAAPPPSVEAPGVTMGEGSADMSEDTRRCLSVLV